VAAAVLQVMPEIVRPVVERVELVVEEMVLLPRVIQQLQAVEQLTREVAVEAQLAQLQLDPLNQLVPVDPEL
jgi:hypothetical protein